MASVLRPGAVRVRLLPVLFVVSALAIITIGVLTVLAGIYPPPTQGELGRVFEVLYAFASVPILAAMAWTNTRLRSTICWALFSLTVASLLGASILAFLRLTGRINPLLPLANWIPATTLISAWTLAAALVGVRRGLVSRRLRTATAALVCASQAAWWLAAAVLMVSGIGNRALNATAAVASGVAAAVVGLLWLGFARATVRFGRE